MTEPLEFDDTDNKHEAVYMLVGYTKAMSDTHARDSKDHQEVLKNINNSIENFDNKFGYDPKDYED